jgi:hypothetical protein
MSHSLDAVLLLIKDLCIDDLLIVENKIHGLKSVSTHYLETGKMKQRASRFEIKRGLSDKVNNELSSPIITHDEDNYEDSEHKEVTKEELDHELDEIERQRNTFLLTR